MNINWDENSLSDMKSKASAPPLITSEMVVNAANWMHKCIAPGSYWVLIEMIKMGDAIIADVVTDMVNLIIQEECILSAWENSFLITCFKDKGDVMKRGNFRWLKRLDQVMKVWKCILEKIIQTKIDIGSMEFRFMHSCSTTDGICILCQMQEKHPSWNKKLSFTFIDLEKGTTVNFVVVNEKGRSGRMGNLDCESHAWWC